MFILFSVQQKNISHYQVCELSEHNIIFIDYRVSHQHCYSKNISNFDATTYCEPLHSNDNVYFGQHSFLFQIKHKQVITTKILSIHKDTCCALITTINLQGIRQQTITLFKSNNHLNKPHFQTNIIYET